MNSKNKRKKIVVLGATGSVGRDVLKVVRGNPDDFEITGLSCNTNVDLLEKFAEEFSVKNTCAGKADLKKLLNEKTDLVVNCIAGGSGTEITAEALSRGVNVALANKEALIADGRRLVKIARENGATILPIDSEICAIHQCLRGRSVDDVEKIVLTASGGPFFGKTRKALEDVTPEQAMAHPTWPNMGRKITIDSATLMNKGFEVIEAAVLFDLPPEKIEVLVHPQSLVHGMVYFKDGNVIMHSAWSDMKIPIHYCLYYPNVKENSLPRLDLKKIDKLEFFEPDRKTFPAINAAYNALYTGTTKELLRDNDEKVDKFLKGEISFVQLLSGSAGKSTR